MRAEVPVDTVKAPGTNLLRIVYVGRLADEQKRITDLTHAMIDVVEAVPLTEGLIIGDGPQSQKVLDIIDRRGARSSVNSLGRWEPSQAQSTMLGCHVATLLSDYEGLPISLMEAMACGCVPVCFKIRSGIPELVEEGITGLLVDNRGHAFVEAIRRLRNDPELWARLSEAARQKIIDGYSHEICADKWHVLVTRVANQKQNRSVLNVPRRVRLPTPQSALESGIDRKPGQLRTFATRALNRAKRELRRNS